VLHRKLQRKGIKSSRHSPKSLSGREEHLAKDVNPSVSTSIVSKAKGVIRAIALEDLKGIRRRVTARRSQRATLQGLYFHDLRQKIGYKANLVGVSVFLVDAVNTSITCPDLVCGYIDERKQTN